MPPNDEDSRKFVVGLGNPGRSYAATRHNVGFRVLRELRRRWGLDEGRRGFSGRLYDARVERAPQPPRRVLLLEPHTYMNRSGQAVREMAQFYQADCRDVLVVMDDLAMSLGRLRMRADGTAGGHNGLADILQALGSLAVPRLRVGIGSPPPGMDSRDYVLSEFRPEELETIEQAVRQAADAVEDWVFHGARYVMDRYNRSPEG